MSRKSGIYSAQAVLCTVNVDRVEAGYAQKRDTGAYMSSRAA